MEIDKFNNINPLFALVEVMAPQSDLKPEGSKYDMHSYGKVVKTEEVIKEWIDSIKPAEPTVVMEVNVGDEILYDPTKSIQVVESSGKYEFVPLTAILAIKENK